MSKILDFFMLISRNERVDATQSDGTPLMLDAMQCKEECTVKFEGRMKGILEVMPDATRVGRSTEARDMYILALHSVFGNNDQCSQDLPRKCGAGYLPSILSAARLLLTQFVISLVISTNLSLGSSSNPKFRQRTSS